MNYFYSIIPPEIQEIIIQNVASLIIQEKWLNFINTKLELERYFIRIKPKNMNKYKFNLFDINFVLNIEKASRIITGRNDNEDKWHRILFDIYNALYYYKTKFIYYKYEMDKTRFPTYSNKKISLYKRVFISYNKLLKTFSN